MNLAGSPSYYFASQLTGFTSPCVMWIMDVSTMTDSFWHIYLHGKAKLKSYIRVEMPVFVILQVSLDFGLMKP
ncbi:hypothetical protein DPD44_20705 [Salmonella enterica subsp. enterica serovar Poona]|nr:hypothetical protein [Salmonella enterica subsp. enterica serovar Poona]